jgi:hypothetical protein
LRREESLSGRCEMEREKRAGGKGREPVEERGELNWERVRWLWGGREQEGRE